MRTCKVCRTKFEANPFNTMQNWCSDTCGVALAMLNMQKAKEKAKKQVNAVRIKEKKEHYASDRQKLTKDAQTAFNLYIRTRDGKKCISCEYEGDGRQFHAGHFMSVGGNSAVRFDENNVHAQCSICNNHLSGNLLKYKPNLIIKIGAKEVERLENCKQPRRYSIEELKEIISTYKIKIKGMK